VVKAAGGYLVFMAVAFNTFSLLQQELVDLGLFAADLYGLVCMTGGSCMV
jgi:hypothetical protein